MTFWPPITLVFTASKGLYSAEYSNGKERHVLGMYQYEIEWVKENFRQFGIEEKKHKESYRDTVRPDLFAEAAEISLFERLASLEEGIDVALVEEDFVGVMERVADLGTAITKFFDEVKVNIEDEKIRKNRLCLLGKIGTLLESIADFSVIEG